MAQIDNLESEWKAVKEQLAWTMTRGTYDHVISRLQAVSFVDGVLTVLAVSQQHRENVEHLASVILRVAGNWPAFAGLTEVVVASPAPQSPLPAMPAVEQKAGAGVVAHGPLFPGWELQRGFYTPLPHSFVDQALPSLKESTVKLLLVVFRRTAGVIVNQYGDRRKEWPATFALVRRDTGLRSTNSVKQAIRDGRAVGLLVWRVVEDAEEVAQLCRQENIRLYRNEILFCLRPRWEGEPPDSLWIT